jgi:hypothetical protein
MGRGPCARRRGRWLRGRSKERAAEATRKAGATADPALKADYTRTAERWIALARSYEFGDFTRAWGEEGLSEAVQLT